jgi:hypothetical protein
MQVRHYYVNLDNEFLCYGTSEFEFTQTNGDHTITIYYDTGKQQQKNKHAAPSFFNLH